MKKYFSPQKRLACLIFSQIFIFFAYAQDPGFDQWNNKDEAENYTARHECSVVQAGDKFYVMGGRENPKTIDVYDYATNTWRQIPDSPPVEFNHFQATEYKGLIWVIGAFTTNAYPNEAPADFIWAFDPVNEEWIQGPEIPENRKRGSAGLVLYNDKFYIAGGNTKGHSGGYVNWFDVYDPATGTWTPLADAPRARDHFHSAVIGDKMYLAGGRLSGGTGGVFGPTIPEVDVYDFLTGTWSTLPADQNIPTPRGAPTVASFNDKLVVIGGEVENQEVYGEMVDNALKITEQYDPVTETWTRLPDLNSPRHGTQAIVSGNGIFVLAGSPNKGDGSQTNMEYLGDDNPVGIPNTASSLAVPDVVDLEPGASATISLQVTGGNIGMFIRSMALTGAGAGNFSITSGALENAFLNPESSHDITVSLSGLAENTSAVLTIGYGASSEREILLKNGEPLSGINNPGTQYDQEGEVINLPLQVTGNDGPYTYSATGLPPDLNIDTSTGVISGTVSAGDAAGAFLEEDGRVVIEAESGELVPGWTESTTGGAIGIVPGGNYTTSINGGTIPYQVTVSTPGVYRFNWRSFFMGDDSKEENDNWLRFPNNDEVWFFGYQGNPGDEAAIISNLQGAQNNIVFPKGSSRSTPDNEPLVNPGIDGFLKIYRSGGQPEIYDWQAKTSDHDPHDIYVWFVNAGTYTLEISERSIGHTIDKMVLYKVDGPNYTETELTAAPESERGTGSPESGAAANSPYQVTVTATDSSEPANSSSAEFTWIIDNSGNPIAQAEAAPLTGQVPLSVSFSGSGSADDGDIAEYLWEFGDALATSSNAVAPSFTFTEPGTFNVVLTVTDADGNTDTDSLEIVVDPKPIYTIEATAGLNGTISPNGQIEVVDGSDQAFTITPNEDYRITEVLVDGISQGPIDTFTFEAVGQSHTIEAIFDAIPTYTITASAGEGGTIAPEGSNSAMEGGSIAFLATADTGFTFEHFLVDGAIVQGGSEYEFQNLTQDHTIEAVFDAIPTYTITASAGEGGTIAPDGSNSVMEGGSIAFSATADTGFTFEHFLVDGAIVQGGSEYEFPNVTQTHTIEAVFMPILESEYTITATATPGGSVSPEGNIVVTEGGSQTFSILADSGFQIADIKVDGTSIAITDSYAFANVTENHTLEVFFAELPEEGNELPKAEAVTDTIQGLAPLTVNFDGSNSTDDKGIVSYEWNFGDNSPNASGVSVAHTFNTPGEYTVTLTVVDTEGETSTVTVIITVSVPSETETGFGIIPNPASTEAYLGFEEEIELENIYVYSIEGRLMGTLDAKRVKVDKRYRIDVSVLSEGLYFISSKDTEGNEYHFPLLIKRK